jgi:hypothetical protein
MKTHSIKTLIFFLALSAFTTAEAQDTVFIKKNIDPIADKPVYQTDTILFDTHMARHILIGTTILPSSANSELAKNYGYNLKELKSSDCKETKGKSFPIEVLSTVRTDTLLTIDISIGANCCYSFLGDMTVKNDSIIDLIYHGYGSYCFCTCCFGLTYEIERWPFMDEHSITHVMINGDESTLTEIK